MVGITIKEGSGKMCELADESGSVVAVLYLMDDGWYIKHDNRHDRHAWAGPYSSPTEAAEAFTPISATGAIPGLTR